MLRFQKERLEWPLFFECVLFTVAMRLCLLIIEGRLKVANLVVNDSPQSIVYHNPPGHTKNCAGGFCLNQKSGALPLVVICQSLYPQRVWHYKTLA